MKKEKNQPQMQTILAYWQRNNIKPQNSNKPSIRFCVFSVGEEEESLKQSASLSHPF